MKFQFSSVQFSLNLTSGGSGAKVEAQQTDLHVRVEEGYLHAVGQKVLVEDLGFRV
jgi:hypothetical protein